MARIKEHNKKHRRQSALAGCKILKSLTVSVCLNRCLQVYRRRSHRIPVRQADRMGNRRRKRVLVSDELVELRLG